MNYSKELLVAFVILAYLFLNQNMILAQEIKHSRLLGQCEGCEAVFEYGDKMLTPVDTLPDFSRPGPKLKISGTIYLNDGKTPAQDVILYIYHTNQKGIYETRGQETGWARRHGFIRGWIKTGTDGRYTFYTLKPGSYPDNSTPAHIHPIILEPNGKYYWLGSYHFTDDPRLTDKERSPAHPRGGGSGVLRLKKENGLLIGERDIVLGLNVPHYE